MQLLFLYLHAHHGFPHSVESSLPFDELFCTSISVVHHTGLIFQDKVFTCFVRKRNQQFLHHWWSLDPPGPKLNPI
jgi:hypothetical protein